MGIFSRLSDIINSNINALLDKAENPEKMIRNIIQEMEDTLVEVRSQAAKIIAERKQLERHHDVLIAKHDDWEQKASLAISKGREDLAKQALAEKHRVFEASQEIDEQIKFIEQDLEKVNEDIANLQDKIKDARSREQKLIKRHQSAQSKLKVKQTTSAERLDKAISRMEQLERKADHIEAQAESHDLGKRKSLSDEIADLEMEDKIQNELEALKRRLAGGDQ